VLNECSSSVVVVIVLFLALISVREHYLMSVVFVTSVDICKVPLQYFCDSIECNWYN